MKIKGTQISDLTITENNLNLSSLRINTLNSGYTVNISGDTMIYGNVIGTSITVSGGTSTQFLKANGSLDNTSYQTSLNFVTETNNKYLRDDNTFQSMDMAVGGYANNLYFSETSSDIPGYETLSYIPDSSGGTETWTVKSSEGEKLLKNYIYPTNVTVNQMPAGVWSFTFYGKVDNTGGDTRLGITYFRRLSGGTEIDLFTVWSSEINNTTDDWFKIESTQPTFDINPTDRMGARVKIKTTSTSNKTITYTVGDGYGAYLNNPNKIRHSQLRDLNGDPMFQHITISEKNSYLTVSGGTINGNLTINGDIFQSGSTWITHANQVYTSGDTITLRDGAISGQGLTVGSYAGFIAKKYDGINDGQLVFDKDGWARVGDVGSLQKLSTIEETTTDGYVMVYDGINSRLKGVNTYSTTSYNDGKYVAQNGGIIYHTSPWFAQNSGQTLTISNDGLSVTLANPISGFQFNSTMPTAKLIVNGVERIVNTYTSTSVVTLTVAFPSTMTGQTYSYTQWGIYSVEETLITGVKYYYSANHQGGNLRSGQYIASDSTGERVGLDSNGLNLGSLRNIMFSSNDAWYNTKDVGLMRNSAGILQIYDGLTGNTYRDLKLRNIYISGDTLDLSGNIKYALQNGTLLYHQSKWFTPSGNVSSSGATVTSVGTQFTSAMIGAKLIISGEERLITALTSSSIVTVATAYSQDYANITPSNWGVYSQALWIRSNGYFSTFGSNGASGFGMDPNGNINCSTIYGNGLYSLSNKLVGWTDATNNYGNIDVAIGRNSANTLEINNGTTGAYVDLALRNLNSKGYNYFSSTPSGDTINDIRLYNGSGQLNLQLCTVSGTTKGSGTWTGSGTYLNVGRVSLGDGMLVANGGFISSLNNNQTFTIQTRGFSNPINGLGMLTGTMTQTAGTFNGIAITPTYNQTGSTASNTDLLINRTETSVGSGTQKLLDLQVGGVSKFNVSNSGDIYISGNTLDLSGNTKYVVQNGGTMWYNTKVFIPNSNQTLTVSSDGLSVTLANPVSNFQFASTMVGTKIIINGIERIVNTYVSITGLTLTTAYPSSMFNQTYTYTQWGVYGKLFETTTGGLFKVYNGTDAGYVYTFNNTTFESQSGFKLTFNDAAQLNYNTGLNLGSSLPITWSNTGGQSNTKDVGIVRESVGLLRIYNGVSTGVTASLKLASLYSTGGIGLNGGYISSNGNEMLISATGNIKIGTSNSYAFASGYDSNANDTDVAFKRNSVGTIEIYDGLSTSALRDLNSRSQKIGTFNQTSITTIITGGTYTSISCDTNGFPVTGTILIGGVTSIPYLSKTSSTFVFTGTTIPAYPIGTKVELLNVAVINTTTTSALNGSVTVVPANTTSFPPTGTIIVGANASTSSGGTTVTYTSKTDDGFNISSTSLVYSSGSLVQLTTTPSYTQVNNDGSVVIKDTIGGTGSTVLSVQGSTGTLFKVSDISGIGIFQVDSTGYILKNTGQVIGMTGTTTFYQLDKTKGTAGWVKYRVSNTLTGAYRAGEITMVWDNVNNRIEFTEVSSNDLFASTSGITLSASIVGNNINLIANVLSGTWNIKISIDIL